METLITIQALLSNIEDFTLESKYHSTFAYKDDRNLEIYTYCWNQAAAYKTILDNYSQNGEILIIIIENAKLTIKVMN